MKKLFSLKSAVFFLFQKQLWIFYLQNAIEFAGEAYRVLMQLFPGLEVALFAIHKFLPAIEIVWKKTHKPIITSIHISLYR